MIVLYQSPFEHYLLIIINLLTFVFVYFSFDLIPGLSEKMGESRSTVFSVKTKFLSNNSRRAGVSIYAELFRLFIEWIKKMKKLGIINVKQKKKVFKNTLHEESYIFFLFSFCLVCLGARSLAGLWEH